MAEEKDQNNKAPAKQKGKSKSPGPRNRNRNRNNRSKSPNPSGQKGKGPGKSKSPARRNNNSNKGKENHAKENEPPVTDPVVETKTESKIPSSPFLMVDGLFVAMSNDYLGRQNSTSMNVLHQSSIGTNKATEASASDSNSISTSDLEKHLTAAFYCDPALNFIVAEAKSTEFVPKRGREITANQENNNPKGPKNSPGPKRNNKQARARSPKKNGSRSKSPGPSVKNNGRARSKSPKKNNTNGGRSKSPGPRQKQTNSKSPAPPKKSNTISAKNPTPAPPTNGKTPKTPEIPKLPLHVRFDPFMVGMVTHTMDVIASQKSVSINTNDRVNVLTYQSKVAPKDKKSVASIHSTMLPQTYLEVEPLMSQMVPEDIADAINMELSMREQMEEPPVEESSSFKTPAKPDKPNDADSEEDLYETPLKDFKGRVAFFEKLTQQRTAEKPKLDPSKKVKAEVSEKVRSAHDQVRTNLVAGNKKVPKKDSKAELPQDLTPLAEKRERVDKFFEKSQETAPAPKPKQPSNWAKVETALPSTFENTEEAAPEMPTEQSTEEAPKVDKLVTEKEKELKAKEPNTNGKTDPKNKGRPKSPKRNKGRSKSPKSKAPEPAPAEENATTTATTEVNKSQDAPDAAEKAVPPTETAETLQPTPSTPTGTEVETAPQKVPGTKERSMSPRRRDGKSKSPVRPKKAEAKKAEETNEATVSVPDTETATSKENEASVEEKTLAGPHKADEKASEEVKEAPESASKENKPSETIASGPADETQVESSSRNADAVVLKESKNVDKPASKPAVDEFPSLASGKAKPAWNADKKSFASILSEGKKREESKKETPGSRFLIPELALAGINVQAIENTLKESQRAETTKKANAKKGKEAEKSQIKKVEQEPAPPKQQQVDSTSKGVEETKEDGTDPGFNQSKRDTKKKKKKNVPEPDQISVQHSEPISEPFAAEDEDLIGKKAFKKHNFNQFDALFEMDVPTEIITDTNGKKEKVRGLRTATPTRPSKKKKGGQTKSKESKNTPREMEFPPELEESPPAMALPLHWVNNVAHTKPLCYVIDGIFWMLALLLGAPIGAVGVMLLTVYKLIMFFPRLLGLGKINPKSAQNQKLAVVITGCDSGFGKDLALSLLEAGFVVFCGCLRKESLKTFENEEFAMPLLLDVTKDNDVDKASKAVSKWLSGGEGRYLHALVNNAGIATVGLVDWITVGEFQKMVDVNFIGMARCTKKILPHFKRQAAGGTYTSARIVNMVSVSGLVAGGLFSVGYEASKHAAGIFTTNLRQEIKSFGLDVTVINPSFHKTTMTKDLAADLRRKWKSLPASKRQEYGGEEYIKLAANDARTASEVLYWDSKHVVDAMQESVEAKSPPARILVGGDAKYILLAFRMLPTWASSRLSSLQLSRLTKTVKKSKLD